jgi:hypothetical protein
VFSPWLACGCDQAIADHVDEFFADGSCAFEYRTCRFCSAAQERHVSDTEAPTVPNMPPEANNSGTERRDQR